MKKVKYLILTVLLLILGITNVEAEGPKSNGNITIAEGSNAITLYDATGSSTIGTINGMSYDLATNTLTLNNYNNPSKITQIAVYAMGDLTIKVKGTNTIQSLWGTLNNANDASNITIDGEGTGVLNFSGNPSIAYDSSGISGVAMIQMDANTVIKDLKINYLQDTDTDSGMFFAGEKLSVINSTITGKSYIGDEKQLFILFANDIVIDNSTIKDAEDSNGLMVIQGSSTLEIKNNSKIIASKFPVDKASAEALSIINSGKVTITDSEVKVIGTGTSTNDTTGIYGTSDVTITNSKILITGTKNGIYGESNVTINSSDVSINKVNNGIISNTNNDSKLGNIIINSGNIIINSEMFGLLSQGDSFPGLININGGTTDITSKMPINYSFGEEDETPITISDDLKVNGASLYSICDMGMCIYYFSENDLGEIPFDENLLSTIANASPTNIIIRDKNWKPAENNTNTNTNIVNNPKTSDNMLTILFAMIIGIVGLNITIYKLKKEHL